MAISMKKLNWEVFFRFDDKDFADRAKAIAKVTQEIRSLKDEMARVVSRFEAQIKVREGDRDYMIREVGQTGEIRVVECEGIVNSQKKSVRVFYKGSLIAERPMNEEEEAQVLIESEKDLIEDPHADL